MLSDFSTKVPLDIEAPKDHRKRNIQRHKLYLKIKDGRRQPNWKTGPTHSTETICQRNYYDTCFLGN